MFIKMSEQERGIHALEVVILNAQARGRHTSESSALIRVIYLLIFQFVKLLLLGEI